MTALPPVCVCVLYLTKDSDGCLECVHHRVEGGIFSPPFSSCFILFIYFQLLSGSPITAEVCVCVCVSLWQQMTVLNTAAY